MLAQVGESACVTVLMSRDERRAEDGADAKNVLVVYGTRPEAIKLAPVVRALRADPDLRTRSSSPASTARCSTRSTTSSASRRDVDLDLMSHGASVERAHARGPRASSSACSRADRPDAVVVQGDTTSAFAASLAAFLADVPVVHVEAGLRTGNLRSPFPEEANRRLTCVVADLHLAPTVDRPRATCAREASTRRRSWSPATP